MANATTTIAGDIQLAGDLTGSATSPALANSGVTAGYYSAASITVDSKGRITDISANLPVASTSVKGVMQVGSGLSVTGGVVSFSGADTTTGSKGIMQVGSGLSVTGGVVSVSDATALTKGVMQVGSGLSVTGGVVSFSGADATTSTKGIVQIGSGLSVTGGVISVNLSGVIPDATTSSKGIVQVGSGLAVTGGVISVPDATVGVKGAVTTADNTNIAISAGGVISVGTNIPKLNTTNTYTAAQWVASTALTSSANITANLALSNVFTLTLAHNTTLTPTSLGVGKFTFIVKQNATGGFTMAFGSAFKFASGATNLISYTANSVTIIDCVCNGTSLYATIRKGFA